MTNSKSTKRALVSSALAVFLCVAMLIGTTFAWFTDTASTSVNKIQAGTLDVALEVKENGNWVSAEGKTLNFVKAEGHENEAILWEPGCTYTLPQLRIVNNGNLALKYKVVITGIKGDAKLNEVIDWTIGTVAQGTEQKLAAGATTDAFTISGTMSTKAGNAYQGLTIEGISITVLATQDTVEYDSTTNEYDKGAEYNTADAKTTAKLITAGTLTINDTLSIDSAKTNGNSDVIRVTGGNHTITGGTYTAYGTKSNSCLRVDGGTVTITGGEFEVKEDNNCIYAAGGNIIIKGGTFKSEKEYDGHYWVLNVKDNSGSVITVMGGKFYKFDPSNARTGEGEIVIADGYKVVQSGDWYYVMPEDTVINDNTAIVANVEELKSAVAKNTSNVDILFLNDIIVTSDYTPIDIGFYGDYKNVTNLTINGNGHTISGLKSALVKKISGNCSLTISNLTVKGATINNSSYTNGMGNGILVGYVENGNVTLNNCHVADSSITESSVATAALIGYVSGNNQIKITDCTVKNTVVTGDSAAGFIGYVQEANVTVSGCKVTGSTFTGEKTNKQGAYFGTVNIGTIANVSNTAADTTALVGRILSTGAVNYN